MRIDIKKLDIAQKIELFKALYADITGHSHEEDIHLAHINEYERKLLIEHGGCGTVNEETGLRQYFGGGGGSSPSDTTTTFAREAPEIEARKLALFDRATALAQQPREIPAYQIAGPAPMEQQAFGRGISQLGVGQDTTNQAIAASQGASQTALGAPNISQFLNPMNSFVIDEIMRNASIQQNQLSSNAIQAGAFGGGREGVQRAELGGRTLEKVGLAQQQNYGAALTAAQNQQTLAAQTQGYTAQQLASLGAQQQRMAGQDTTNLAQMGQTQRGIAQAQLDAERKTREAQITDPYARAEFEKGIMTALPTTSSTITQAPKAAQPNPLSQALGTGLTAYTAYLGATNK
tara:strand:- start:3483 stop:4526 length:1044 start_codon:yes stop_codon:yes gene_type:complete